MTDILNKRFITPLLCFFSGSLCAFAMAPYNVWGIFLFGFAVLYWAIDKAPSKRKAFAYGWLWAFGYFVFSLYWIGNALLVDGNPYQWAWPLAVCGLPALLAFFNGFACLFAKRFCALKRWHGYLGFVSVLSLSEYARGHVFTGFPWNLFGYTWIDTTIAQIASFESVYLLTFLTLLWLGSAGFYIVGAKTRATSIFLFVIAASFFASFLLGASLIHDTGENDDVIVKIVQPNTDQAEKWQREKMDGHFMNAIELSKATEEDVGKKTLIVWPETTLSPSFLNAPYYRQQIAEMLQAYKGEAVLMTGALRYDSQNKVYYNSLLTIDDQGEIGHVYDKSHLVPFGEYIPFQNLIPIPTVTQFTGFAKGDGPTTFTIFDGLSYSPLVCYEILFPHHAVSRKAHPDMIVNVTNDGWYGDSAGPRQHLVKAQFRAIEERVSVLRAANTGISAIITPYGEIIKRSDIYKRSVLFNALPNTTINTYKNAIISFFIFPLFPLCLLAFSCCLRQKKCLKN